MTTTIPATAPNIAANVVHNGPAFNSDQVSKHTPQELGEYVAYMIGTRDDLERLAAFVDALKGYNKDDSEAFREAFSQTLERRYTTNPADIAAEEEEEARRERALDLADRQ